MEQVKGTVNRVELIGWLGADPEQRFLPSGVAVCSFRVATKRLGSRNEAGERTIETDWTPVESWERLAERCGQVLHRGSRVRVAGSLHTHSWQDAESGQRRYRTVVRADDVIFLDARLPAPGEAEPVEVGEFAEQDEDIPF